MAANKSKAEQPDDALSAADVVALSALAGALAQNDRNINPRELINAEIIKEQKARVLYENGYTLTRGAAVLLANAQRKEYNHRRRLDTSIKAATGKPRPAACCAHHIVALTDFAALPARIIIFKWNIGINDADNGVFLPAHQVGMPNYPKAVRHSPYHAPEYHTAVLARVRRAKDEPGCRLQLRRIKKDLLAGTMALV